MDGEEMRIAIAEACGWRNVRMTRGEPFAADDEIQSGYNALAGSPHGQPLDYFEEIPNYPADLNAMHEAKRKLLTTTELCCTFNNLLIEEKPPRPVEFETDKWSWGQSAEAECRALLKTLGLWVESGREG